MTGEWPTADLLAHRVRATPDATALVDAQSGRQTTYRDLDASVRAVADRLEARLGSTGRPRVGVAATVEAEFVTLLYAVWRLRGVAVPLAPDRLRERTDRAGVDIVVGSSGDSPAVDHPSLAVDVPADADGSGPDRAAWEPDETALVLFTSGTTGDSKGVRLTHRNLVASATASAFRLGVTPGDRWLCCLPTNHMGGLAPIVRSTLYGTAVVLQSATDPESLSRTVTDHRATGISLVPTLLARLLDAGWEPPPGLRFVLLGGAPAGEALLARCDRRGVPVYPTYGTTETASQIATATPAEAGNHPGTVGQPVVSADVEIVDDGTPCPPGTVGEVVVDGPMVAPGYLDEEATREAFGDRGLHTGDIGYCDEDGRLWIEGRVDDAIQTGGETVHPARVAAALRGHPQVADAAVVGLPDEEWGERVAALVVPAGERTADVRALRDACRDELAPHEVPKTIETAPELPRTESGTVDRVAVRRRLER